ncbi:MAG TPA: arylamine N-acetyltransferase [Egibacteraceae bacterium]|nr:arylamine N-acetyltransferase [Egibacteraceae bacterium]
MTTPTVKADSRAAVDEWGIERLDVTAYLHRIAYSGALTPTVETLRALHRAHVAAIPFENVDIVIGRMVDLDIDRLQGKLLHRRRGGYCYEHNLLFAALLEHVGYRVTRLVGRVQPAKPGPRTHMLLRVEAEAASWLADVGFGGAGLLEPILLEDAVEGRHSGWVHRIERVGHGMWLLRTLQHGGWVDLYRFTLEPHHLVDYAVSNHYTTTHPRSPFVRRLVVQRTAGGIRHSLRGHRLTTTRTDGTSEHRDVAADELLAVLRSTFRIDLNREESAQLSRVTRVGF